MCSEHFDKTAGLATPTKQPLPHDLDKLSADKNLPRLRTEAVSHQSSVASEQFRPELELEQFSSEEDSWDSVIDGPVSSQLLEQHKICEDSLLEIMNCDTDDLLANI